MNKERLFEVGSQIIGYLQRTRGKTSSYEMEQYLKGCGFTDDEILMGGKAIADFFKAKQDGTFDRMVEQSKRDGTYEAIVEQSKKDFNKIRSRLSIDNPEDLV